jgi:hypothetical protein
MRASSLAVVLLVSAGSFAVGQVPPTGYPVKPVPLPDAEEIALAVSAAPTELSGKATVYAVRDGKVITIREGTNGSSCMVARDLHGGSLYPICYNAEGSRTMLQRELLEVKLRSLGVTEDSIDKAVTAAYKSGQLQTPKDVALAYMMSPRQVLFSSPKEDGRRVGAWQPHLMLYVPNATPEKFGLTGDSGEPIQVGNPGTPRAEVIIKVQKWADGTPIAPPKQN